MKVLILSCNTGGGHNAAGRAVEACFRQAGIPCDLVNTLSFASRLRENVVCKGHVFAYRHLPKLYGTAYRFAENHPPKPEHKSGVYRSNIRYADRVYEFIVQNGYDTVICVHVFAANALTAVLAEHPGLVRSYFVATDYTCSPGVSDTEMDGYVLPHPLLKEEFEAAGLSAARLLPLGIPVGMEFYTHTDSYAAKQALQLPTEKRVVLLMCGSMGCGPMVPLVESCMAELPADCILAAVCGDNRKLKRELEEIRTEKLRVVGYTDQINQYMDAAVLLLTKAGGLSSTEAAAKGLPILFVDAVPGCESRNRDFFVQNGYADSAPTTEQLVSLVIEYLAAPAKIEKLKAALAWEFPRHAAQNLVSAVRLLAQQPPRSLKMVGASGEVRAACEPVLVSSDEV